MQHMVVMQKTGLAQRILYRLSIFVLLWFLVLGLFGVVYGYPTSVGATPNFYWPVFLISFGLSPYSFLLGIIDVVVVCSMLNSLRARASTPFSWPMLFVFVGTFIASSAFLIYAFYFVGVFFGDSSL